MTRTKSEQAVQYDLRVRVGFRARHHARLINIFFPGKWQSLGQRFRSRVFVFKKQPATPWMNKQEGKGVTKFI